MLLFRVYKTYKHGMEGHCSAVKPVAEVVTELNRCMGKRETWDDGLVGVKNL